MWQVKEEERVTVTVGNAKIRLSRNDEGTGDFFPSSVFE